MRQLHCGEQVREHSDAGDGEHLEPAVRTYGNSGKRIVNQRNIDDIGRIAHIVPAAVQGIHQTYIDDFTTGELDSDGDGWSDANLRPD